MTTIVYRDRVLAGDTRITIEDTVLPVTERKIFRLKDSTLFAYAGDCDAGAELFKSVLKRHPLPKLSEREVWALMINPNGQLFYFEGNSWVRQRSPYCAIGTGMPYALGALAMGATAIEAVRVGMKFDAHSGGRVQSFRLGARR